MVPPVLAPLILSPGSPTNVAEVAAPVLQEFVSVSPRTNLVWRLCCISSTESFDKDILSARN